MSHLLDVSVLLALIWPTHTDHQRAKAWYRGKRVALCPITELGFIRISSGPLGTPMADTRKALQDFIKDEEPDFIPADIRALDREAAPTSGKTTDWYLANLAAAHSMQWATFDKTAKHPNALLIT